MEIYHPPFRGTWVVFSSALGENPAGNIPVHVYVDWKPPRGHLTVLEPSGVFIDVLLYLLFVVQGLKAGSSG